MLKACKIALSCAFHDPCLELNYYDEGAGEAIILAHGLGEEASAGGSRSRNFPGITGSSPGTSGGTANPATGMMKSSP
jgi:hypothetical protein